MKCINCDEEAGRKGNRHVKFRKFTCTRMVKRLETKRKWYGAREENWVVVEVPSYYPYDFDLTDWQSTDENRTRYADSRFDDYSDRYSSRGYEYETPSRSSYSNYSPTNKSYSDDYTSSGSSYDSTPSSSSYDSSPSQSSLDSSSPSDSSSSSSSSDSSSSCSD